MLSLRQREGVCLVEADGAIRRGIEANLVNATQGWSERCCTVVRFMSERSLCFC
jgi:hypothetical protein